MKSFYLLLLSIVFIHMFAASQEKDSLGIHISKIKTNIKNQNNLYRITIINLSVVPIGILHSATNNLVESSLAELGLFNSREKTETYSLTYSVRDATKDYETSQNNINGEVLLPTQKLVFKILIPTSSIKQKFLNIDYILIPNYCYNSFRDDVFNLTSSWYLKYTKIEKKLILPSL